MGLSSQMANLGLSQPYGNVPPGNFEDIQKANALVCKLVHMLNHNDTDITYEMLAVARRYLEQGGPLRIRQTLVSVIFAALRLAQTLHQGEKPQVSKNPEATGPTETDNSEQAKTEEAEKTAGENAELEAVANDVGEVGADEAKEADGEGAEGAAEKVEEETGGADASKEGNEETSQG